jgi:hypothetical protein
MEVEVKGKGQELAAAPQVLKSIDLWDKVVMGDALHTQRAAPIQIVESIGDDVWFAKGNQPQLEEELGLWLGPDPEPNPGYGLPNNLVLGLLIAKKKFRYLPSAIRLIAAHPSHALTLLTRL